MDPKLVEAVENINRQIHLINVQLYKLWLSEMLFKWHWWLQLALTILPWVHWYMIRKKESTHRLLYAGFFVAIISSFLDFVGMSLGLWGYPSKLIPLIPPFVPWDTSLLPVMIMIFLQYKPQIHPVIKGVVLSAIGSFIAQPLFQWIGIYNPKVWKHYYTFPFLIVIYIVANYLATRENFKKI